MAALRLLLTRRTCRDVLLISSLFFLPRALHTHPSHFLSPFAFLPTSPFSSTDNPWTCSCNLLWMASFYEKVANNETRKELRHTTCRAPGLGEPNALHLPVGAKLHVIRDLATNLSISDKCDDLETSIWSDGGDENALDNSNVLEQHRLANVADSARRFESPSILILSLFLFSIPLTVNFSPR